MRYDTSETDQMFEAMSEEQGSAMKSEPDTYYRKIEYLKGMIDYNMEFIYNTIEAIKGYDEANYQSYLKEYTDLYNWYQVAIQNAYQYGQESINPAEQDKYISELELIMAQTNELVQDFQGQGFQMPQEQSIWDEGIPPDTNTTAMVKHDDEIIMENVGMVRGWWSGLGPNTKLLVKAGLLGGAFYGVKKLWDFMAEKYLDNKE